MRKGVNHLTNVSNGNKLHMKIEEFSGTIAREIKCVENEKNGRIYYCHSR